jgi:amino acid adenylation domain-containing protein
VELDVPESLRSRAAKLAREEDAGLPSLLLAAWAATLTRATGEGELLLGVAVPSAGPRREAPTVVPVRQAVDPDMPFRELVRRVHASVLEVAPHREVGYHRIREVADRPADAGRAPLVQTVFRPGGPAAGSGVTERGTDVDLDVEEAGSGLRFTGDFAAELFEEPTVAELLRHLTAVLEAGLAAPEAPVRSLPRAAPGVMERVAGWNATDEPLPDVQGLAEWLAAGWEGSADRVAVVAGEERLTYGALAERADRLARYLVGLGVEPGGLVGLCLERTVDMVVAAVAVWRAGAGYVPLDPTYPRARLDLMADRAGLAHVVSVAPLQDRVPGFGGRWILLDREADRIAGEPARLPEVEGDLSRPAYVIFTSGSTGEPKGVQVPGRAVVNFLETMRRRPGFSGEDTLLAVTTLSFDISVLELFLPLLAGGTVVVASAEEAMDGRTLAALLDREDVSVMQATPSTWRILLESGWEGRPGLRVLCGGEPFPQDLVGRLLPRAREVWNMYGPTETTVWSTAARLTDAEAPVVIGTPIGNTRCHVLDEEGRPLPPGVPGELNIGGLGVTDGYVGRPEETRRRFPPDPFAGQGRMYRTGDVVRWRRDGQLEHLRRKDQQVKLRGFRIELGEVEAALAAQPRVRSAVAALAQVGDSAELVGYAVAPADGWDERALREELATRLPAYMVPRFLVRLEELPRTENNKIDRKALPAPVPAGASGDGRADVGAPEPVSEGEAYLLQAWRGALELERISPEDNFFDLGGHSLLAVRLIGQIRKERGVEVPLRALITGSLRGIARSYLADGVDRGGSREDGRVPDDERDGRISRVLGSVRDWMAR